MNNSEIYQIVCFPQQVLQEEASPVGEITDEVQAIADKMQHTMYENEGIGLAANQVGIKLRIIVLDVSEEKNQPYQLANPEIIKISEKNNTCEEGCLSIPNLRFDVKRPEAVTIKAIDIKTKKEITIEADGILATCLQHEIDHINGILIFDRVSRLKRYRLIRQYNKLREQENQPTN